LAGPAPPRSEARALGRLEPQVLFVTADHVFRGTERHRPALAQPERAVAQPLERVQVVRRHDQRGAGGPHLPQTVDALPLEVPVPHGQDLVHEHDGGLERRRDREAQAHHHARAVRPHGTFEELTQLGELLRRRGQGPRLRPRETGEQAHLYRVLAPAQLDEEAGAQLQEGGHRSRHLQPALRGARDAHEQVQERALSRSVLAHHRQRAAARHIDGHVAQGPEVAAGARRGVALPQSLDRDGRGRAHSRSRAAHHSRSLMARPMASRPIVVAAAIASSAAGPPDGAANGNRYSRRKCVKGFHSSAARTVPLSRDSGYTIGLAKVSAVRPVASAGRRSGYSVASGATISPRPKTAAVWRISPANGQNNPVAPAASPAAKAAASTSSRPQAPRTAETRTWRATSNSMGTRERRIQRLSGSVDADDSRPSRSDDQGRMPEAMNKA